MDYSYRLKGLTYGILAFFSALMISCEDKVREFDGFTQKELEFLLSGAEGKTWLRTERMENDIPIEFQDCSEDNYIIFVPINNAIGKPKPLLYGYNPAKCDSLDFCTINPAFCESHLENCNEDPDLCDILDDGMLLIGSWYAKAPFVLNDRADTLVFNINNQIESIYVTNITSKNLTIIYKNRKGENGETITESYVQFVAEGQ